MQITVHRDDGGRWRVDDRDSIHFDQGEGSDADFAHYKGWVEDMLRGQESPPDHLVIENVGDVSVMLVRAERLEVPIGDGRAIYCTDGEQN